MHVDRPSYLIVSNLIEIGITYLGHQHLLVLDWHLRILEEAE